MSLIRISPKGEHDRMYAIFTTYRWQDGWFNELYATRDTQEEAITKAVQIILEKNNEEGPKYGLQSIVIEDWTSDDPNARDDGLNIVWSYDNQAHPCIDPSGISAQA